MGSIQKNISACSCQTNVLSDDSLINRTVSCTCNTDSGYITKTHPRTRTSWTIIPIIGDKLLKTVLDQLITPLKEEQSIRSLSVTSYSPTYISSKVLTKYFNEIITGLNNCKTKDNDNSLFPDVILSDNITSDIISSMQNHINSLQDVCICNCNYCTCECDYCTCNCNHSCQCNCNYCTCNCNYCTCNCHYCTCQCNYCTCNCNYCPCNCNYCTCNCNYCTCNCNYGCTCQCNYVWYGCSVQGCPCQCNNCTCNCNYCTCHCNYCTCNCNYCPCNCNYCTCNCNY